MCSKEETYCTNTCGLGTRGEMRSLSILKYEEGACMVMYKHCFCQLISIIMHSHGRRGNVHNKWTDVEEGGRKDCMNE